MHSRMCNPKDCGRDKIEDVICGEGAGCMIHSREERIEIYLSCRLGGVLESDFLRHLRVANYWLYLFGDKVQIHKVVDMW